MTYPTHRQPSHPGFILKEDFIKPHNLTHAEVAKRLHVSFKSVSALVNERQGISPEMAIRLGRLFGTSPEIWLNLQTAHDLWHIEHDGHSPARDIRPLSLETAGVP